LTREPRAVPTLHPLARLALTRGDKSSPALRRSRDKRRAALVAVAVGGYCAILLHAALVIASERSLYVRDPVYSDKERKLARLEQSLPPGSSIVVFVGTSRTGNGFDAGRAQAVLSAAVGRPAGAFNFGTPASGPLTHLLHVKRILADGHRPALLLLELHAPVFAELPDGPLEGRFADGTVFGWEELDLLDTYGCDSSKLRAKREEVVAKPWYALRFQLVGRLAPTSLPYYLRHDWSRGPDPNGWNAMLVEDPSAEERAVGLRRAEREYAHILRSFKLGDGPIRALRDTLALARERGIPVMLVRMPEGASFRALYPAAVAAQIDEFLRDLATEFRCRVADCRLWMADDAFVDGHHLLRTPAGAFSERLASEILVPALRENAGGPP
jgi:hypothetical protein